MSAPSMRSWARDVIGVGDVGRWMAVGEPGREPDIRARQGKSDATWLGFTSDGVLLRERQGELG